MLWIYLISLNSGLGSFLRDSSTATNDSNCSLTFLSVDFPKKTGAPFLGI